MTGNWKIIVVFLKSVIVSVLGATITLGLIGYLLAGFTGLVNLAIWGAILGFVGGLMSGLTLMGAKYSEEMGGNLSRWNEREEAKHRED